MSSAATAQTAASPVPSDGKTAATDRVDESDIIVTGSRIERSGFDAPTPTTSLGGIELRQGNPVSIADVLNASTQFRATSSPATTTGNTNNSAQIPDLRGLGPVRTLTLLNGHRFIGANDLNTVPKNLVKRIDVVTGGASAAYGSGAVAGVVNVILDDDLKGLTLGVDNGIASRADAVRYGVNGSFGTSFADGRGHVMIGAEYLKEEGAFGRDSRPNLKSAVFQQADGQLILANNVQYTIINQNGIIAAGRAAGQVFNPDGSLSPLALGSQTAGTFTVNGGGQSIYDFVAVTSPYQRVNAYGRVSFDVTDRLKVWADGSFTRISSDFAFLPTTPLFAVRADNAFLTPTAKTQLAALGATYPLTVGRIITDVGETGYLGYKSARRTAEGSLGFSGSFGSTWKYDGYFDHGETRTDQSIYNQTITAKFNKAIDAVIGPNGTPVCRVNVGAVTAATDPACAPLNLLGSGNASAAAVAYAFGAARQVTTSKLDAAGFSLGGQPFSTWAGPVDIAVGGDYRKESLSSDYIDPLSLAGAFGTLNFAPTNGSFNVKEAFGEINVPLLELADTAHIEVNGAARYSDYSTSGGIWSWKVGGTMRLVNDLLLRSTYSRDIRSPSIAELYSTRGTNIGNAQDPYYGRTQANVVSFLGGNPDLTPETSHTLTVGGSYAPHYVPRLNLSVDYFRIDIRNAIATLTLLDTLTGCYNRQPNDTTCGGVIARNPDGTIASVARTNLNLAGYKTSGLDMEASYLLPLDAVKGGMDGSLRFRLLATHVFNVLIDDGVRITDRAGVVGDTTTFTTPRWRATGSITYQGEALGVDLRARYVGGGIFSQQLGPNGKPIANNDIASRVYIDLGAQYQVKQFTLYGTVNNLFDRSPPYVTYATPIYDMIGRYYSVGAKVKF